MAVVSALVRRPLEQVGGSGGPDHPARSLRPPLSVLFLSPPGLGAAEEALPPDGAGGAAGNAGTPQGPSSRVEAGVAPARWRVGAEGSGGGGGGLGAASSRGLALRLLRPSARAPRRTRHAAPAMGDPSEGTGLDAFPLITLPPLFLLWQNVRNKTKRFNVSIQRQEDHSPCLAAIAPFAKH